MRAVGVRLNGGKIFSKTPLRTREGKCYNTTEISQDLSCLDDEGGCFRVQVQ